jgi:hypothetical protein
MTQPPPPSADPTKVLENIRAADFADTIDAALIQSIYDLEHQQQFEDDRGPIQAALRDLIIKATEEPPT